MKFDILSYKIIGICLKVYKELKAGFPEKIYHRALELEFQQQKINYISEYTIPIYYQQELIAKRKADFLIEEKLIIEIKAIPFLNKKDFIQTFNYIEICKMPIALLINFGNEQLEVKRLYNKKL